MLGSQISSQCSTLLGCFDLNSGLRDIRTSTCSALAPASFPQFLPRDAMLSSCVRLSVCQSVTSRHCLKMSKRKITHTTPYDSPRDSSFLTSKISAKVQQRLVRGTVVRTLVFDRRTFPVPRSTCMQLTGDHLCMGKTSATGQPTRPTQPFILSSELLYRMCAARAIW